MVNLDEIEVKLTDWNDREGIALRALQRKDVVIADYRGEPGIPPSADDVPIFLILSLNDQPIACGGLRPLFPPGAETTDEVEIKRMFVLPGFRGKENGVADFLMRQLELAALAKGWTRLKIETAKDMYGPRRFYKRQGFQEIELFGHYVEAWNSVCYEKILSREERAVGS